MRDLVTHQGEQVLIDWYYLGQFRFKGLRAHKDADRSAIVQYTLDAHDAGTLAPSGPHCVVLL